MQRVLRSPARLARPSPRPTTTRLVHPDYHSSAVPTQSKRGLLYEAGQPQPSPSDSKGKKRDDESGGSTGWTGQGGVFDTALGIAIGTTFLGLGGVAYFQWYKWNVLRKMEIAFKGLSPGLHELLVFVNSVSAGGYDPVLELEKAAQHGGTQAAATIQGEDQEMTSSEPDERIRRVEQDIIDRIIKGQDKGHYYLLLGPKGCGKTSMIIQAVCPFLRFAYRADVFNADVGGRRRRLCGLRGTRRSRRFQATLWQSDQL